MMLLLMGDEISSFLVDLVGSATRSDEDFMLPHDVRVFFSAGCDFLGFLGTSTVPD